jgi:hypothetical protein
VSFVNKFKKNDFINKTNIEKLVYKYKEIFNEKNTNFTK